METTPCFSVFFWKLLGLHCTSSIYSLVCLYIHSDFCSWYQNASLCQRSCGLVSILCGIAHKTYEICRVKVVSQIGNEGVLIISCYLTSLVLLRCDVHPWLQNKRLYCRKGILTINSHKKEPSLKDSPHLCAIFFSY